MSGHDLLCLVKKATSWLRKRGVVSGKCSLPPESSTKGSSEACLCLGRHLRNDFLNASVGLFYFWSPIYSLFLG